jgi:sialate O-acetylesterase
MTRKRSSSPGNRRRGCLLLALLLGASALAARQPAPAGSRLLHPLFDDHAIVQRDRPFTVYGETTPGADVVVTLGPAKAETRAARDGQWTATLPALAAGGPYTLTASTKSETKTVTDVLVGDVFFCSGQSNMAFSQRQAQGAADDARIATDGQIRQFTVPANASLTPRRTFAGNPRWIVGSPETVGSFSAACYYFAREVEKTVNVPVGLVVAAYGGARLRTFTSEETLRKVGLENEDLDILDQYRENPDVAIRRWGTKWETWWSSARPQDGKPWMPEYDDRSWETAPQALGAWALWHGTSPDGFIGQMWMRTTFTLSAEDVAKKNAQLDLGAVNQEDETWVNGTYVGASSFANRTRYAIPSGLLKPGINVVTTNIYCGWRDCGLRGPAENRAMRFEDGTAAPLSNAWRYREVADGLVGPRLPWGPTHGMTLHYNGMIAPLGAYTFRGAVWYQGESDVHFPVDYYKTTLLAMMAERRRQFHDPDLPFLIVQLPGYGPTPAQPTASTWANLREAQRQTALADPRCAIAVTMDIGDATDLHPTNKREVGRRLSIAARHEIYGEGIPAAGPVATSAMRHGSSVVIVFRDVTGALQLRDDAKSGFELCEAGQSSCRWATARIDGTAVVLSNAGNATRVRYAWGGSPVWSVIDGSGLPATPFELPIR